MSPHTSAIAVFQDQTATGKLNALIIAYHAEWMPALRHEPVARRAPKRIVQTVELARQADREVADVDHLLDLAQGLGLDLADFQADQGGQVAFMLGQQLAETLHDRAAGRGRHHSPGPEGLVGPLDGCVDAGGGGPAHGPQQAAVDRRGDRVLAGQHQPVAAAALQGGTGQQAELTFGRQ